MSDKKIPYLSRNFNDYRESFLEMVKKYYPDMANDFNDASIGSWIVDLIAAASDNLSYHIDKVFNETSIDSAQQPSSLYSLARSNGFKVPGPKGAMVKVEFSCQVPIGAATHNGSTTNFPLFEALPLIKRGTRLSAGRNVFEVVEDVDFQEHFDDNGEPNWTSRLVSDKNGTPQYYIVTKTATAVAGETKIYKQYLKPSDIKPFMEILIPDSNIMEIESVITKSGTDYKGTPKDIEFFMPCESSEGSDTKRFFEVDSLLQQYRWGDDETEVSVERTEDESIYRMKKGMWKPIERKFITEYTDKGFIKVIFGSGTVTNDVVGENFTQKQIYRMINNTSMGVLPEARNTLFIRYRAGGGVGSNIAANTLTTIDNLIIERSSSSVTNSIKVNNPYPSISGKDMPTVDELRNMIKYHNAAQNRCVTLKDYEDRVMKIPSRYGSPFRVAALEENNKVMLYMVNVNNEGKLTSDIPQVLVDNVLNYLSMYRTLNDYVEVKPGRILNIGIEVDIFADKNYNAAEVMNNVVNVIEDYMNINKRYMGEDIFIGDLQRAISDVDGVLNLIETRIYNKYGEGYSSNRTTQETVYERSNSDGETSVDEPDGVVEIDLVASNYVLISDADCIFELKNPDNDICVKVKQR